jgi:hypothetical protein
MATKAFKPALRDSETCGSGLVEESGTLQRYGQGRVEDLEGYIDRCLRLSDLTTAHSNRRPNTREPLPPINERVFTRAVRHQGAEDRSPT